MRKPLATIVVASCLMLLLAAPARAGSATVHIAGGAPSPAQVTVAEGDMVTFVNNDDVTHAIIGADGLKYGESIPPGGSEDFGPFTTGGQGGRFDYRVDQGGAAGTVVVQAPGATTTTKPATTTTTTRPTTTSTTAATTTTTSTTTTTTVETTTTSSSTTTTTLASAAPPAQSNGKKDDSPNVLAVLGFALVVAGIGGLVVAMERSRRRRAPR